MLPLSLPLPRSGERQPINKTVYHLLRQLQHVDTVAPVGDIWVNRSRDGGGDCSVTYRLNLNDRSFANIFLSGQVQGRRNDRLLVQKPAALSVVILPLMCAQLFYQKKRQLDYYRTELSPSTADVRQSIEKAARQAIVVLPVDVVAAEKPARATSSVPLYVFSFRGGVLHMLPLGMQQELVETRGAASARAYMREIPVCHYIANPDALGLVLVHAVAPRTVYGCVLFELRALATEYTKPSAHVLREHVRLTGFVVDSSLCDSDEARELKQTFLKAACASAARRWPGLPVVCHTDDADRGQFAQPLRDVGFKSHASACGGTVLAKSATPLACGGWTDCQQLARRLEPQASDARSLALTNILYTGTKRRRLSAEDLELQKHRPVPGKSFVTLPIGAGILCDYYYDKFVLRTMPQHVKLTADMPLSEAQTQAGGAC
jgi:hypothetical protein